MRAEVNADTLALGGGQDDDGQRLAIGYAGLRHADRQQEIAFAVDVVLGLVRAASRAWRSGELSAEEGPSTC
ncbi:MULTISPECIES: hypothetical protein [unclassified Methylobacterium]|uniref:hypothetical protein n=1 Tax=unclassified Methylobacterium TaxID=2615210 RepID=UPI0036FA8BCD